MVPPAQTVLLTDFKVINRNKIIFQSIVKILQGGVTERRGSAKSATTRGQKKGKKRETEKVMVWQKYTERHRV